MGDAQGDHRTIIVELQSTEVLGTRRDRYQRKSPLCRTRHDHPGEKRRLATLSERHARKNKLLRETKWITNITEGPSGTRDQVRYEKLNRLAEEGYRYANKRVRRVCYNNKIPWTPEWALADRKVQYCEALIKKRQLRQAGDKRRASAMSQRLRRMAKSAEDATMKFMTTDDLQISLQHLKVKRAELEKTAASRREDFLQRKARSYETEGLMDQAKAVRLIRNTERERKTNAKIKSVHRCWRPARCATLSRTIQRQGIGPEGGTQLMEVEEPIEDKSEFFRASREEWTRRTQLTNTAPTMQERLQELLGYSGMTETGRAILEGTFQAPPGTDPVTKEFLEQHLSYIPDPPGHQKPPTELTIYIVEEPTLELPKPPWRQPPPPPLPPLPSSGPSAAWSLTLQWSAPTAKRRRRSSS